MHRGKCSVSVSCELCCRQTQVFTHRQCWSRLSLEEWVKSSRVEPLRMGPEADSILSWGSEKGGDLEALLIMLAQASSTCRLSPHAWVWSGRRGKPGSYVLLPFPISTHAVLRAFPSVVRKQKHKDDKRLVEGHTVVNLGLSLDTWLPFFRHLD